MRIKWFHYCHLLTSPNFLVRAQREGCCPPETLRNMVELRTFTQLSHGFCIDFSFFPGDGNGVQSTDHGFVNFIRDSLVQCKKTGWISSQMRICAPWWSRPELLMRCSWPQSQPRYQKSIKCCTDKLLFHSNWHYSGKTTTDWEIVNGNWSNDH